MVFDYFSIKLSSSLPYKHTRRCTIKKVLNLKQDTEMFSIITDAAAG